MLQTPSSMTLQVREHVDMILPRVQLFLCPDLPPECLMVTPQAPGARLRGEQAVSHTLPRMIETAAFQTSLLKTDVSGQGGG